MKCLVLGGGGFLGSHLSDKLLEVGYSIRIFERPNLKKYREFLCSEKIEWIEGDFANEDDLAQAVSGCDLIFHLISTTLPKSSNDNPVYDVETNLVGTLKLLSCASRAKVKKIIFLSSGGTIYGIPQTIPLCESHPNNPICSYGITKLAIEKYLHLYNSLNGIEYCILRLSNPFGERQKPSGAQGAVAVFLDKALKGEMIEVWGNGSVVRDYIYVQDAVSAMIKAIEYTGNNRIFNIGSGKGQSLNDIIDAIENLLGYKIKRTYSQGRPLDVQVNVLDIECARHFLQWTPQKSFQQGLKHTLVWLRGQLG